MFEKQHTVGELKAYVNEKLRNEEHQITMQLLGLIEANSLALNLWTDANTFIYNDTQNVVIGKNTNNGAEFEVQGSAMFETLSYLMLIGAASFNCQFANSVFSYDDSSFSNTVSDGIDYANTFLAYDRITWEVTAGTTSTNFRFESTSINLDNNNGANSILLQMAADDGTGNTIFNIKTLPIYVDNAAAIIGNLPLHSVYKTPTGELRIRI